MPKAAPRITCFFINLEAEMARWTGSLLPIRRTCTHVRRIEHIVCLFCLTVDCHYFLKYCASYLPLILHHHSHERPAPP
jgi:hypothetical protein